MAKLFACKTFRDVTAMAQQVFGGVGFTLEYDIQLYFRRAKQLQISWCDDRVPRRADRADAPRLTAYSARNAAPGGRRTADRAGASAIRFETRSNAAPAPAMTRNGTTVPGST